MTEKELTVDEAIDKSEETYENIEDDSTSKQDLKSSVTEKGLMILAEVDLLLTFQYVANTPGGIRYIYKGQGFALEPINVKEGNSFLPNANTIADILAFHGTTEYKIQVEKLIRS